MNDADKMTGAHKCPECGSALPRGVLAGLCPACLLKQATADSGTQPETPPFEPPSIADVARLFPSLEILELLGKGGMGAVYKARQPALDRFVALKILPQQVGAGPGFTGRFTREARALARLNHPNIIGVYEFGQVDGLHYFIMEYVDGASLRQLERSGRLSPRDGLQIVLQICEALQYAHDEGVVHRDIKPENILLDRKGRVKIADFGLAKILGREPAGLRLTGEGQVMGTPHYMAPEQVEHPLEVDHRADIYALGVVFYEMLTGELPLGKFASPSRKVRIDVRLDEVVLRSLEKEPELRYQQASEVKSHLQTITGNTPVPERAGACIMSETHTGKRRVSLWRLLAAGWGILLVCVVLGIIYWAQEHSEKPSQSKSSPELPLAYLSQGTIQLVAVSYHPSKGKEWWSPDGAATTEGPFENPDDSGSQENSTAREFVFRVRSLPADASAPVWAFDSAASWGSGLHATYNGRIANDLFLVPAVFPKGTHKNGIKAGIAMGAWQPGCETGIAGPWVTQWGDSWSALFAPPQETSTGTMLTVTHTIQDRDVRIVAVNLAGREITSLDSSYSTKIAKNTQITATFPNLPLLQIRSFRLQIRPYQWVKFHNVSLEPGQMTHLKIDHANQDAPPKAVPPEPGNRQPSVISPRPEPLPAEKTQIVTVAPFAGNILDGTVEFLALAHLPAAEPVWWKPNGTSIGNPDFRINPDELAALPQVDSHLFVFRLQRHGTNTEAPAYNIDLARHVPEFTGIQMKRAQDLKGGGEVWWIAAPLQNNVDFTKVKLSFPVGNWYELARAKADLSQISVYGWPGEPDRQIKFTEVNQDGADLWVTMTRLEDGPWWTLRLRAVDTNGVEHPELYATASGKTNEYYTWRYRFKDCTVSRAVLALSQIKEFLLQSRRVETVEFRNVSLQPGKTSKVEISERGAPVWSEGGEMPPSIPRKTSSDQLKPIPPEVIARRQAIKDLSRLFPGPLTNDETRLAFEKELVARSRAFNASLAGTIAEPLVFERDELMRERNRATNARDVAKDVELTKQILALSEKIGALVDEAEKKLRATNGTK